MGLEHTFPATPNVAGLLLVMAGLRAAAGAGGVAAMDGTTRRGRSSLRLMRVGDIYRCTSASDDAAIGGLCVWIVLLSGVLLLSGVPLLCDRCGVPLLCATAMMV